MPHAMCCFSAGLDCRTEKDSAICLLRLQMRRRRLVAAVSYTMSHWVCCPSLQSSLLSSTFSGHQLSQDPAEPGLAGWLQSDTVSTQAPGPGQGPAPLRKTPAFGSSHFTLPLLGPVHQKGPFQCHFVFSGQIRNPRPQNTALCFPKDRTAQPCLPSRVTRALNVILSAWLEPARSFPVNQQTDSLLATAGHQFLLKTSSRGSDFASSHCLAASRGCISLKALM